MLINVMKYHYYIISLAVEYTMESDTEFTSMAEVFEAFGIPFGVWGKLP